MILTLEVVGPQASKLGASARKVFAGSGGSIGRLPENDWAIPDPYISGKHARVDFRDNRYYLIDTSTNGVFVNSQDNRLTRSQPYALNDGDRIFIDAFEIRVAISGATSASPPSPLSDLFGVSAASPIAASTRDALHRDASARAADPFAVNDPFAPSAASGASRSIIPEGALDNFAASSMDGMAQSDSNATDPLKLLGLESNKPASGIPRAEDLARRSPLTDNYVPPAPIAPVSVAPTSSSEGGIPDDYDPLSDGLSFSSVKPAAPIPASRPSPAARATSQSSVLATGAKARPMPGGPRVPDSVGMRAPSAPVSAAPPTARQQSPVPTSPSPSPAPKVTETSVAATARHVELSGLLVGAGLSEAQITPELIENFGRILRVVVAGLMDVLRSRERIKDEFRMRMTTFKVADNNPLKFSANVDDALHNLLVKRNAAYLGPVEAFEDAFQDVRNHQMAMLAGMRVAFDAMLSEFDPERLKEQFDRHVKKGSLLSAPAKLRYWDQYADKFRAMVSDQESTFRDLFGEEFARAYEDQLERLKAAARANKK